jgi:hypothetical protein
MIQDQQGMNPYSKIKVSKKLLHNWNEQIQMQLKQASQTISKQTDKLDQSTLPIKKSLAKRNDDL